MSKPGNWEVVEGDPAPGDPAAFDHLVVGFQSTAEAAGGSSTQLQKLAGSCDDSIWSGKAADTFRDKLGKLPGDLAKLHESYNEAACALQSHAAILRDLQRRAGDALDTAVAADDEIRQAEQAASTPTISAAPGPVITAGGPVITSAGPSPADQALEAARTRLANAKAQIEGIREENKTAESNLVAALERASKAGIQNKSHHWWNGVTDSVVHAAHAVGDVVHKTLRDIGEIADNFSSLFTAAGVVLVAVALAVALVSSGGMATPLVVSALSYAETAGTLAAVSKSVSLGAEASSKAAFHDSDLHWGTIAKEGAVTALGYFGAAKLGKVGLNLAKSARNLLPVAKDAAEGGEALTLLDRAPAGVKHFVELGKDFGGMAKEKAKPLIEEAGKLKENYWGSEDDPRIFQRAKNRIVEEKGKNWGTHDEAKWAQHTWHMGKDSRELFMKYNDDPIRILRPFELPAEHAEIARVPCHRGA